uniref:Protein kinase domain-containing protein n=1 Tax=Talaromyces marneffei PM1 TaxID=1077442 RepID=A0A093XBF6_TALMA
MEMQDSPETSSWRQEFLSKFTAIPASETTFSLPEQGGLESYQYNALEFKGGIRVNKKHPISVWRATANNRLFAIKQPVSDQEVMRLIKTFREAFPEILNESILDRLRQDYDPFILEKRAYERIYQASKGSKAYFPECYDCPKKRILVIEYLRPSLTSRCICSNSVPAYFSKDLELLRKEKTHINLSNLEKRWYESLFIDRLKRLTALHSIGITHGDIKEDHFRLPGDFHDTVLFDFSRAYTITSERPYLVQGRMIDSRYTSRWAAWRRASEMLNLAPSSIKENAFKSRYDLNDEDSLAKSSSAERELIAMRVYRVPAEFAFPSLASILPFLEEASTGKLRTWLISMAGSLEDYVALWIKSHGSGGSYLIAMASESGETTFYDSSPGTVKTESGKYYLFLIPRSWLEMLKVSEEFATRILMTRSGKRAWTVNREASFG